MELPNKYNALIEVSVPRIRVSINPSREAKVIAHSCRESVCCPTRFMGLHLQNDFAAQRRLGCHAFRPSSAHPSSGPAECRPRTGGILMGFDRSMGSTPHAMFAVLRHRACGSGPTVGLSVSRGHQAIEDYRAHRIERDLRLVTRYLEANRLFGHRNHSVQ
jgi:hypothetical protein